MNANRIFNFTNTYEKDDHPGFEFIDCTDITGTDMYCDDEAGAGLLKIIDREPAGIHLIDSGNYHYMTRLFTSCIKEDYVLVFFDNHTDMKPAMFDMLSCGSWAKESLEKDKHLKHMFVIGPPRKSVEELPDEIVENVKLTLITREEITAAEHSSVREEIPAAEHSSIKDGISEVEFLLKNEGSGFSQLPIYISVDKDVLDVSEVSTNWDQGNMSMETLLHLIDVVCEGKKLIGADICGLLPASAGEVKSAESYEKGLRTDRQLIDKIEPMVMEKTVATDENRIDLPAAFRERMKEQLGDEYEAFERALLEGERYRGLRVNPLKANACGKRATEMIPGEGDLNALEMISGEVDFNALQRIPWTKYGYYYSEKTEDGGDFQPGKHPFHEAGVYYIQEPSAMLPAELLEPKPGERILDLCAAPGGKSTQIAGYMEGKGLLVSNEINVNRAKILSENIERMGIKNAVVISEAPENLTGRFEGFFDRIMVDAPCSGEGMFRKNDEAISEWSEENVKNCAERQAHILDCAAIMLRAGGRIVYSTCTFAREEDEESIEKFLKRHPEFTLLEQHRLWPHRIKGEGHFAAVLEKTGPWTAGSESDMPGESTLENPEKAVLARVNEQPLSASDMKKVKEWLSDILKSECFEEGGILSTGRLENFGENIYLVPSAMPGLKGLKVLRPGLHIGSLKKDRFEPAHSLALAISPAQAQRVEQLTVGYAVDYIKGLTQNTEAEKGWTLVTVEGYSLGWGKSAGGILKNHYPKGLRKDTKA